MVTEVRYRIIGALDTDFIKATKVADLYYKGLPLYLFFSEVFAVPVYVALRPFVFSYYFVL